MPGQKIVRFKPQCDIQSGWPKAIRMRQCGDLLPENWICCAQAWITLCVRVQSTQTCLIPSSVVLNMPSLQSANAIMVFQFKMKPWKCRSYIRDTPSSQLSPYSRVSGWSTDRNMEDDLHQKWPGVDFASRFLRFVVSAP